MSMFEAGLASSAFLGTGFTLSVMGKCDFLNFKDLKIRAIPMTDLCYEEENCAFFKVNTSSL